MARVARFRFSKAEEAKIRREAIVGLRMERGWIPVTWTPGPGGGPGGYVPAADPLAATFIQCPACGAIIKWNSGAAAFRHEHSIGRRVTDSHISKHPRTVWKAAADAAALAKHGPVRVEV